MDYCIEFYVLGSLTGGGTPGSIPNPAVKSSEADDTETRSFGKVGSRLIIVLVMSDKFKVAIFSSGSGSNFEAIVKAQIPNVEISLLFCVVVFCVSQWVSSTLGRGLCFCFACFDFPQRCCSSFMGTHWVCLF